MQCHEGGVAFRYILVWTVDIIHQPFDNRLPAIKPLSQPIYITVDILRLK